MLDKNNFYYPHIISIIFALSILVETESVNERIPLKKIFSYREESLYLDKENPIKFFWYQNNKYNKEDNYDIIVQIKDLIKQINNNCYMYVYTSNIYISNVNNLIQFNEDNDDLIDYKLKFDLNTFNENYSEYSLIDLINENINDSFYPYYYVGFSKGSQINYFKCNFIIFNTLDEIEIIPKQLNTNFYYRYENNYRVNNYIFKIYKQFNIDKYLNLQLLSKDENTLFNINILKIINGNITSQLYSLLNFNKLDYTLELNGTQILYLNLTYIQNMNDIPGRNAFAIFFDFINIDFLNNYQKIPEQSIELNFLSRSILYFYSIIDNKYLDTNYDISNNLFYILKLYSNDNIVINQNYFILEYFITNEIINFNDDNYTFNNDYLNDLINSNIDYFIKLKSFVFDSRFFYKANINKIENLNKLFFLKIYINDNDDKNKLKLKKINIRYLPLILLKEELYNYNKSYIKYYTSSNYLDNFGYYYMPIKYLNKKKILYCPYENTMDILFGEFDITEAIMLPSLDNQKLIIINELNNTLYNGITIITENQNSKYFLQFGEIDGTIYDNLKINNFKSDTNMNKEIILNDNIKELYFFNMYNFNDSVILDINTIYGNVTVEYLSLDTLTDIEKNFYNIFPFNKDLLNNNIKTINDPILIDTSSIEIIRIVNNQYINNINNGNNIIKAFLYINKYKLYSDIEENQLVPLYISSDETFIRYKINLNSLSGEIKYKFFFHHQILLNENNNYNVSILINNNEFFYLTQKYNNMFHIGNISIIRYNQVRIENICHQDLIVWAQIGNLYENEYEILYASEKAFNGVMTTGTIYLFIFDYINIINKEDLGLYPYKFVFNLEKPISNKCNGYYHQSLVKKNSIARNYIFRPNNINSIYYEFKNSGDNISFCDKMSLEELNLILKDKFYLYTLIQQINGYLLVDFHLEYKYDLSDKKNELISFDFDESIYSINYKLAEENKNKYLLFQVLVCERPHDFNVHFFKENSNISFSLNKNNDNDNIETITQENIFGYINIEQINNEENKDSYIGIIRPGKLFVRYLYTNSKVDTSLIKSLQDESKYQYNINIEKKRKVENKDIFSISFDCFLKNTITNYYILTLNDEEDDIINECQFLSYLYKYNNKDKFYSINKNDNRLLSQIYYNKYLSFKDEGTSDRISKEITFESFGNYKVYILAEELENYSLYKLLGVKTYSYIDEGNDETNNEEEKTENEVSFILILLIIVLSLLIIILSAFIIYHYVRKENINQIISFMNLPNKDSANLGKNNMLISFISNRSDSSNNSKNNFFFPILNNSDIESEDGKDKNIIHNDNNISNSINNINNISNNNNNELDLDEEKSEPPPPPITAIPPENMILEMLNEIKKRKDDSKIYDQEKVYTNDGSNSTNQGE